MRFSKLALVALTFSCLAFAAVSTQAQVITVPNGAGSTQGDNNNRFPFSTTGMRFQQVYNASEFAAITQPELITQIAFRLHNPTIDPVPFTLSIPNISLTFSTTLLAADTLSPTFATNVGANATTVFSGPLTFTLASDPHTTPEPFNLIVNLPTPFLYDPAAGNLLLDVLNSSGSSRTDIYFDRFNVAGDGVSRVYSNARASTVMKVRLTNQREM